jgi:hypothetical protein
MDRIMKILALKTINDKWEEITSSKEIESSGVFIIEGNQVTDCSGNKIIHYNNLYQAWRDDRTGVFYYEIAFTDDNKKILFEEIG